MPTEGRCAPEKLKQRPRLKIELQMQPVILYLFRVEELAEGYGAIQVGE